MPSTHRRRRGRRRRRTPAELTHWPHCSWSGRTLPPRPLRRANGRRRSVARRTARGGRAAAATAGRLGRTRPMRARR
eukprot:scaffold30641_cov129-Isochrysis_galbana.AAC.2